MAEYRITVERVYPTSPVQWRAYVSSGLPASAGTFESIAPTKLEARAACDMAVASWLYTADVRTRQELVDRAETLVSYFHSDGDVGPRIVVAPLKLDFYVPTLFTMTPNVGPAAGGQSVTITGTHLTGVTSITLGGSAVTSLVIVDSTTATAVTGAHAPGTNLPAVLTTFYGTSGTSLAAYSYT